MYMFCLWNFEFKYNKHNDVIWLTMLLYIKKTKLTKYIMREREKIDLTCKYDKKKKLKYVKILINLYTTKQNSF